MPYSMRWSTVKHSLRRNLPGRISVVTGLALAFCVILAPRVSGGDKTEGLLSVPDALTSPGKPVQLTAILVRAGMLVHSPLGGEPIEFVVDGHNVGRAMTGGDGRAFLEFTPRMRGNQTIVARLASSPRVESREASGTLFSWERRRPLLLVQMAALVEPAKAPALPIPTVPIEGSAVTTATPVPQAADELKRLSEYYFNVVYLVWGGEADPGSDDAVKDWLDRQHFPAGVKLRITGGAAALNDKLDDLKGRGWDNVKAGVGRTPSFAAVLSERRILAIIMPASDREEAKLPRKTAVIKSWSEVRKKLQG